MKILQICSARTLGGGERHVADLANSLAERGHTVYAALAPGSPLSLPSLPRHHILEARMRNALDFPAAEELARFTRECGVELIHAHLARDYPLAALAAWRAGNTPYVLTRHVLFPLSRVHRLTLRNVSRVIAVSEAVAGALKGQAIFDPNRIVTIPNGVDVRRFAEVSGGRRRLPPLDGIDARLLVGAVGELTPNKGQQEFIRAACAVASERDDVGFVLAGEDSSRSGENRAALERLIAELGLVGRVHLVGWVEDVPALLGGLDLFVSPSRSESFGLAIVEAMASGLAVVASASGGALEVLEDGETGRLVPVGDHAALAEAIKCLLADDEGRRRMGSRAALTARERFSLERVVERTEQVYGDVLRECFKT